MKKLDEDLLGLFDEETITKSRKEAEAKYQGFTTEQINHLKKRCKNDLFFLCNGPLEYTKLSPRLHGNLAKWIQKNRDAQYREELLPRGHYKSTIITIGDSIQMALPNIANLPEHPYCLGPNVKLLIAHEVRESAAKFLFEISAAFTKKPLMLALWPECIPTKNLERLNKYELDLPRKEHHKEATFTTLGAGGASQGNHFNWLKLDDLIGEEARDSETVMARILQWFDNINSLLTEPSVDGWDLTGTRWAFSDVYSHAFDMYGIDLEKSFTTVLSDRDKNKYKDGMLRLYARGAIENNIPIFPEQFSMEFLNILRKNRIVWAAQYANNPMEAGMTEFDYPVKFYNVGPQHQIILFDKESGSRKLALSELDIVVLSDPSMGEHKRSDETGIVVTGVDKFNNIFILETVKKRLKPPQFVDELFRLHLKYRPRLIAIEEVNFSGIYKYWIEDKGEQLQVFLPIRAYNPGNKRSKESRIRGLGHFFSAGQIYILEGMHDLREEYENFPLGNSQHLLDALAQGPTFWNRGMGEKDIEHEQKAEAFLEDERSALTGY